jgi:hypothetical protein
MTRCPVSRRSVKWTDYWLALVVCVVVFAIGGETSAEPATPSSSGPIDKGKNLTRQIRYQSDAGAVVLVWGIDGWNPVPDPLRPSGTTLKQSLMNTPMSKTGDVFVATVQAPDKSVIDFGFLITKSSTGADVSIWDGNSDRGYHAAAEGDAVIEVLSPVSFSTSGRWTIRDTRSPWFYLAVIGSGTLLLIAISVGTRSYRRTKQRRETPSLLPRRRFQSRGFDVLLLGISLLMGIGISEYALRFLAPHGGFGAARELDWMRTNPGKLSRLYTVDEQLGFRPILPGRFYNEYGTLLNGYNMAKRPGVTRLLFLGDSVTYRGTIIDALRRLYGDELYEYWNAGVESYNTVQEVNFYKAYNYRIHPDHVIVTFHPNDFETTPVAFVNEDGKLSVYAPNRPLTEMNPFLFQHSRLYRLLVGLATSERRGEEAILKEIIQSLTTLRDALREEHIRLTVLVLPLMAQPELWSSDEEERRRHILQALNDLRIPHVDLLPPLLEAIQRHIPIQESPGDIWHPSPALSDLFAQYIRSHGVLEGQDIVGRKRMPDGSP